MPNIDINGTVVSFPDDLSPDQLKSAASAAAAKMSKGGGASPEEGSDKENTMTRAMESALPGPFGLGASDKKKVAKVIQTAGRGTRAIGVGAERLIADPKNPSKALNRAAEATKPDYVPQEGEKLGAFAGSMADPINLAVSAAIPGSGIVNSMAAGAAVAGAQTALQEVEKTGNFKGKDIATDAARGAAGGAVVHGVVNGPGAIIENFPTLAKALANVPKRASEIIRLHPEIIEKYKGDAGSIIGHVKNVMDVMNDIKRSSSEYFGATLDKLGISPTREENLNFKPKPYTQGKSVKVGGMSASETTPELAAALQKAGGNIAPDDINGQLKMIQQYGDTMAPKERLKSLLHLRQSVDYHMEFNQGEVSKVVPGPVNQELGKVRQDINNEIGKTVGGDVLRDADAVVSSLKRVYNKLQPVLQDRGKAESYLRKVFAGEGADNKQDVRDLFALEKETGKPVITKLWNNLTSEEYQKMFSGSRMRSTVGGLSALVFARVTGIPYSVAIGIAGASQSPALLYKALRVAQIAEPIARKLAIPAVSGGLTLLKNRKINQLYGKGTVEDNSLLQGSAQ